MPKASQPKELILAGDLGGTNFRIALFEPIKEGRPDLIKVRSDRLPSPSFSSFHEAVQTFLRGGDIPGKIVTACFGFPGPNIGGVFHVTNLNWAIDLSELPQQIGVAHVDGLNDLEATAFGIGELRHSDFVLLQAGAGSTAGNQCVIAPGTGLGEAALFWDKERQCHIPFACEGGHTDFAPTDDVQAALLAFLRTRIGRVSFERLIAGIGLSNIYRFLRDTGRGKEKPSIASKMLTGDVNAIIDFHSRDGSCSLCRDTMDIFTRILGAEAGNLALKIYATGGVYLAGGIAPQILEHLRRPLFLESFLNKGRMRPLLEGMPISVVMNDDTALLGSARRAYRMLSALKKPLPPKY